MVWSRGRVLWWESHVCVRQGAVTLGRRLLLVLLVKLNNDCKLGLTLFLYEVSSCEVVLELRSDSRALNKRTRASNQLHITVTYITSNRLPALTLHLPRVNRTKEDIDLCEVS